MLNHQWVVAGRSQNDEMEAHNHFCPSRLHVNWV